MRRSDHIVIFPIYIDSSKSKRDGRRVSKPKCVPGPRLNEIAEACTALGLDFSVEENAHHPRESTARRGLVRVRKQERKAVVLEKIALEIRRSRKKNAKKARDK